MRRVERPLPLRAPETLTSAFARFLKAQSSQGALLLVSIGLALIWANLPWGDTYEVFWDTDIALSFGRFQFRFTLHDMVNEGLMTLFFLLVGLEIKREILVGELASLKSSLLPMLAALGGMALPALIYLIVNWGGATQGWAIPVATDIALVGGMMSLLRGRVPVSLQVFMLALAIVDDIIAIAIIAFFYSGSASLLPIAALIVGLALLAGANLLGVRHVAVYGALGLLIWFAMVRSGIHPTLAGVLLALVIPARSRVSPERFLKTGRRLIGQFAQEATEQSCVLGAEPMQELARELKRSSIEVRPPLSLVEDGLGRWVAYVVMPLFALANGGIELNLGLVRGLWHPVVLGIVAGLVIGKQAGILLASLLSVRLRLAALPKGASWLGLYGTGWLGGIGFTVAIFIATLAFEGAEILGAVKAGILLASAVAGLGGWLVLRRLSPPQNQASDG